MDEFTELPILDVAAIYSDNAAAKQALAKQFAHIYGTTGFGYICNHGVPARVTEGVFAASERFHNASQANKMSVELNHLHRGYIPINTSTDVNSKLADVKKPNQSESFMVMREDAPDAPQVLNEDYLAGPNQWPELENFKQHVVAYQNALSELSFKLVEIVALALDANPDDLRRHFTPATTWLRLLYYPPAPPIEDPELFGSAPHTDFGFLTILAQDDIGGLQVQTPSGKWIDAPRIPDTFVVNVGDMLHRWSNGRLKSTPHRVINRSGNPRYSCPFFYDPNVSTDIAPLPSTISAQTASQFEPINFGEFLKGELQAGYKHHKKP